VKSPRRTARPPRSKSTPSTRRAPRTNEELTAHTRAVLVRAGRELFGEYGFAGVSASALGERGRLTRGALHHHFGDKAGLFAAVVDDLLAELMTSLATETMRDLVDHQDELEKGVDVLLALFQRSEVQQILLRDASTVLGWQAFNGALERAGLLGLIRHGLEHWVEAGRIEPERVEASSRILLGAAIQAALALGQAGGKPAALDAYRAQLQRTVRGLARG
jgi:AcrR family transcriptional regulator